MSHQTDPRQALELVRRCADGDEDAWREFMAAYGPFLDFMIRRALSSVGAGRLPDPEEVADLRSEIVTWLMAERGRVLRTYRGESKITSWIGVLVARRARRLARRGGGLKARTVSLDALGPDAASHLAVDAGADGTPRAQALSRLAQALEALPDRDRSLLRGAFYEQKSYADLATELGVRPDSVGQLLFRAKRKLKEHLGEGFLESLSGSLAVLLIFWSRTP